MTQTTKKITLMLQIAISLTTGILTFLFASILKMPNQSRIFIISSTACFIAISFTIWNITRTFKAKLGEGFDNEDFFHRGN